MKTASRNALFWLLALSAVWEWGITVSLLVHPEFQSAQYGGVMDARTIFFSNIIGGFMAMFSALCSLTAYQVRQRDRAGITLSYLIGIFFTYMGIGLYLHEGAPAYVLLDPVRGIALGWLAYRVSRENP